MTVHTKTGLLVEGNPLRALNNGYLILFSQDRLIVASIMNATECREVESHDLLHHYQSYL
jgi:hypothetical protein